MAATVQVAGLREFLAALKTLPQKIDGRGVLEQGARPLTEEISRRAARSDEAPHIADNIVIETQNSGRMESAAAVGPSRDFDYGPALEFGTSRQAPQPFVRPGFDAWRARGLRDMRRAWWARVRDAARRVRR